jgi:hypothetical protein
VEGGKAVKLGNIKALNRERGPLIDKKIAGTITEAESIRLKQLNALVDEHIQRVAPRPDHGEMLASLERTDALRRKIEVRLAGKGAREDGR